MVNPPDQRNHADSGPFHPLRSLPSAAPIVREMGAAAGRAQLLDRVSRDGDGRAEEQERDETADQEIWPAGPEEPDRSGRGEHADVRDDVVARADPGRAQVE